VPLNWGQKNPAIHNWPNYKFQPDHEGTQQHGADGTGLLTDNIVGLDIDVRDPKVAAELEALARRMLGKAPRRIGAAPKVLVVYRIEEPIKKMQSTSVSLPGDEPNAKKHRVEILGKGQQFVAYNVHPETNKPYKWNGAGDPLRIKRDDLPEVTREKLVEFIDEVNAILRKYSRKPDDDLPDDMRRQMDEDHAAQAKAAERGNSQRASNPAECREAIAAIPNDDALYDDYVRIGHAIAGALGANGHDAWHEWAAKSAKYNEKKSESDWKGFMKADQAGTLRAGAGTVIYEARKAGWTPKRTETRDESEGDDFDVESIPDSWLTEVPPPQKWLWDKTVPIGSLTTLIAEGGSGKTWLSLRLAVAVTRGSPRFLTFSDAPRPLQQGAVVFVNAEDPPDAVRRRLWAIIQRAVAKIRTKGGKNADAEIAAYKKSIQDNFHFVSLVGKDIKLVEQTGQGRAQWGSGLGRLLEKLRAVKDLALVVLDPLARLHNADENSNTVSTMLVNAGERIAQEFGCAVVVCHHVSKEAATRQIVSAHAGRGGGGFGDGARSVLRLTTARDADVEGLRLLRTDGMPVDARDIADGNVVTLHHAKSSYGGRQRPIWMIRDRDTGELLPLKVVGDSTDAYTVTFTALKAWLEQQDEKTITRGTFRDDTKLRKQVFGSLTRGQWTTFVHTAIERGDLVVDPDYATDNPGAQGYRLAS
jgi:hypothetical protein